MGLVVTMSKKAIESDGISFSYWYRLKNLQTLRISLNHYDLTMTIKILIPKTIWEVVRMQQQIREMNVSQQKIKKPLNTLLTLNIY